MVRGGDRMQASTWKGGEYSKDTGETDSAWRGTGKRDPVQYFLVVSSWLSTRCKNLLLDLHSRALMVGRGGDL